MKSYEWNVADNRFRQVDDPTYDPDVSFVDEAIRNAGYVREFSSQGDDAFGATISVYSAARPGKPAFYVDLTGENSGIATFVAGDFLSLLTTLQQIQPFLTLIRLDQVAWSLQAGQK